MSVVNKLLNQVSHKALEVSKPEKDDARNKALMREVSRSDTQKNLFNKPQPIQADLRLTPRQTKQTPGIFKSGSAKLSVTPLRSEKSQLSLAGSADVEDAAEGETLDELVV